MLDVGDGNQVYWEVCGNPRGTPAVVVHGGPGSGCGPGLRRYFNPDAYRIVLFDQRQCGRSTPHASDPATDLRVNTTAHLLADLELLREHLGVDRWLMFGDSWGAVLGLAYAERHPDRVSALVLTASIVTHYWRYGSWLDEGEVLREAGRLAGIPGVVVQGGGLDFGNLLGTPWELTHAWPGCELVVVHDAGHDTSTPGVAESLVAATDRFA